MLCSTTGIKAARATDTAGRQQSMDACWSVLGYGNNGIEEHATAMRMA